MVRRAGEMLFCFARYPRRLHLARRCNMGGLVKERSLRRVRRTPTSWGGDYRHSRGLNPTVAWSSPLAPPSAARSVAPVRSPVCPEDSFPQVLDCGLQRSPWGALSPAALGLGGGSRRAGRAWWGAQVPLPWLACSL